MPDMEGPACAAGARHIRAPLAAGASARAEAKAWLRIEDDGEDALIDRLVAAAGELCEQFTGQALIARDCADIVPASGAWRRLVATPVRSILSAASPGTDGVEALLPAVAYATDIDAAGDGWVRLLQPAGARRLRVEYQAGLAEDWAGLPEALKQGMLRLAGHLYAHRDGAEARPPAAVSALWRPYRRLRIY